MVHTSAIAASADSFSSGARWTSSISSGSVITSSHLSSSGTLKIRPAYLQQSDNYYTDTLILLTFRVASRMRLCARLRNHKAPAYEVIVPVGPTQGTRVCRNEVQLHCFM